MRTSVESRPMRASQREEMSRVSKCSHEFRKVNTETTKSVNNTLKSKEIFVSVMFEDSLIHLHSAQHKQPVVTLFFTESSFLQRKRSDGAE